MCVCMCAELEVSQACSGAGCGDISKDAQRKTNGARVSFFGRFRLDTCALVGNAGALLTRAHGTHIDRYPVVMRLNRGYSAGFEPYVGRRCATTPNRETAACGGSHALQGCRSRVITARRMTPMHVTRLGPGRRLSCSARIERRGGCARRSAPRLMWSGSITLVQKEPHRESACVCV